MRSLQDEIVRVLSELKCPICCRAFTLKDIRVQSAIKSNIVELVITCHKGHAPVALLIPVSLKELSEAGPISKSEVRRAYQKIDKMENLVEIIKNNNDNL